MIIGQSNPADVGAALGDVAHPFAGRLGALDVLERLDLQPRDAVVGDLEGEVDGPCFLHGLGGSGLGEGDLGHDGVLLVARHLADGPLHRVVRLIVVHLLVALVLDHLAVDVGHLLGHVELDVDEGGSDLLGEGRLELSRRGITLTVSTSLQGVSFQKKANTLKGALKSLVMRQFMTMNSPSGGEMRRALLVRNSLCCTDSWKLQSSRMMFPGELVSASVTSSLSMSLSAGLPTRQLFIWMHPSTEELMTQPEELKRMLIFSQMSMKISFWLFLLLTETEEAEELTVLELKSEKLPSCFLKSMMAEDFSSTTSLAMRGLMWEVLVSCGCPKSMISSRISQMSTKFLRMASSLITPQKSFMITTILFSSSRIQAGEMLNRVVATTQIDDFFRYAKLMPQMLKMGSVSPLDSFTRRQNNSGVFLMRSDRKSRFIMESPRADRKNICEII